MILFNSFQIFPGNGHMKLRLELRQFIRNIISEQINDEPWIENTNNLVNTSELPDKTVAFLISRVLEQFPDEIKDGLIIEVEPRSPLTHRDEIQQGFGGVTWVLDDPSITPEPEHRELPEGTKTYIKIEVGPADYPREEPAYRTKSGPWEYVSWEHEFSSVLAHELRHAYWFHRPKDTWPEQEEVDAERFAKRVSDKLFPQAPRQPK